MKYFRLTIGIVTLMFFSIAYVSFATEKGKSYYEEKGRYYEKKDILWDIKTEEKVIALTFDDGPHATYTPQILDLLQNTMQRLHFSLSVSMLKSFQILS